MGQNGTGAIDSRARWDARRISSTHSQRLVAQGLIMGFEPDTEQRLWRTVVRRKYQLGRVIARRCRINWSLC